ncbi:hypothetical protein [Streptomyces sp. NPDC005438]|uniref:hypothetical protein n=1 Tax=Streptomyces sp. NPDC005438 TaxID=3156880 RepID=UPI0033BA5069
MKRLKSRATAIAFGTALAVACGFGAVTANASSGNDTADRAPKAANLCTEGAASSGDEVPGQLSRSRVSDDLGAQTRQHREARGWSQGKTPRHPLQKGRSGPSGKDVGVNEDLHPAQGTAFLERDGNDGACATHSVSREVNVTEGSTTIYTPTLYPAGGSCIELVTVYTQSQATVSAWDWCETVSFQASVPIDDAFVKSYTDGSSPAYTGRVVRTDEGANTWTAELYNHETGQWDELYTKSGTTQGRNDGWDIYELYSSTNDQGRAHSCDAMAGQTFESTNITVRNGGQWSAASPDNSNTGYDQPDDAFKCPERTYEMVNQYDHWKAVG